MMCWSIHEVSPAVPTWLLQEAEARRAVSAASRPTGSYLGNNSAAHYQRALVLPDNCSSTSESFFRRRKNTETVRPSKQLYINPGTVALAPDEGGSLIFLLNSTALISLLARPSPPHNEAVFEPADGHAFLGAQRLQHSRPTPRESHSLHNCSFLLQAHLAALHFPRFDCMLAPGETWSADLKIRTIACYLEICTGLLFFQGRLCHHVHPRVWSLYLSLVLRTILNQTGV